MNQHGNSRSEGESRTQEISLLGLADALRRRKFYILLPVVLLTAGFAGLSFYLPPSYRAEVVVMAQPMVGEDYLKPTLPPGGVQQQLVTIRETLFRRALLEQVIEEFGLYPQQNGRIPDKALESMASRIAIRVEGEETFSISFDAGQARQAADVANRLAERFIERRLASREQRVTVAAGFFQEQVEELKGKLSEQEKQIREYKKRSARELPEYVATNLRFLESLQEQLQKKKESMVQEQARRAAVLKEMRELESEGWWESEDREKSPRQAKIEELQQVLKDLEKSYTEQHPEVSRVKRQIEELQNGMTENVARNPRPLSPLRLRYIQLQAELEGIDQRLKSYQPEQERIRSQIERYERRIESAPQHERTLAQLIRDYEVSTSQYHELLEKQHEASLARRLEEVNQAVVFRIIEPARVPSEPHSPKRHRLILMGLLAGLGLGVVLAFLAEQLDTTFENVEEFHAFTNIPVLATIPSMIGGRLRAPSYRRRRRQPGLGLRPPETVETSVAPNLVTLRDPFSMASEQYRLLAMKVRQHMDHHRWQVLLVTSSSGDEGKTTTAINLSVVLSELAPGPVLLLDADLRKPDVHEYLKRRPSGRFSDLLLNPDHELSRYLQKIKKLFVLPTRGGTSDPLPLLSSARFAQVLERLRQEFSYLVLDAPPIVPVADTHVLAGLAEAVLLVVRAGHTRRELFRHALESFESDHWLGVVLNDFHYQRSRYGYAYEYYQKQYQMQSPQQGGGR